MRIAMLSCASFLKIGGAQIFVLGLLQHLSKLGHEVHMVGPASELSLGRSRVENAAHALHGMRLMRPRLIRYAPWLPRWELRQLQHRHGFDVWQVVGAYPAGYAALGLKGLAPLVLRTHGEDVQTFPEIGYGLRLDPMLDRRIRQTFDGMSSLVALTESVSQVYEELGIARERITEIPNGFNIADYQAEVDVVEVRRAHDVPEDVPLLLTVGRYHPKKAFDLIPAIANELRQRGQPFHWLVVGPGMECLCEQRDALGLSESVKLLPAVEPDSADLAASISKPPRDLVALYRASDVFVFPSRIETFGRVLVEAMATRCAVVTTDAPGCRDVITHEETGLLSAPCDVNAMVANTVRFLEAEPLRTRILNNAVAASGSYDWQQVAASYEKLYSQFA